MGPVELYTSQCVNGVALRSVAITYASGMCTRMTCFSLKRCGPATIEPSSTLGSACPVRCDK